jgi:hypothetical protein
MSANRRRLRRLEARRIYQLAAEAGAPHGFTAEQVIAEARRFFALSDDEQRAKWADLYAQMDEDERAEMDEVRRRHGAIVRQMPNA